MKRIFRLTAIIAFLFISITTVQAQRRNARYNEYIKQYAPLAVEQMQRHKIPASITLAQGLLVPDTASWRVRATTTSASSVEATGADGR